MIEYWNLRLWSTMYSFWISWIDSVTAHDGATFDSSLTAGVETFEVVNVIAFAAAFVSDSASSLLSLALFTLTRFKLYLFFLAPLFALIVTVLLLLLLLLFIIVPAFMLFCPIGVAWIWRCCVGCWLVLMIVVLLGRVKFAVLWVVWVVTDGDVIVTVAVTFPLEEFIESLFCCPSDDWAFLLRLYGVKSRTGPDAAIWRW